MPKTIIMLQEFNPLVAWGGSKKLSTNQRCNQREVVN